VALFPTNNRFVGVLFEIREILQLEWFTLSPLRCKMEAQDEENSEAQRQNSENLVMHACAGVCV